MAISGQQLEEMYAWYQARLTQQLVAPVDDVSRAVLGALTDAGKGSVVATQSITISSTPQTITVPKTPDGTRIVNIGGAPYNVPFYL